MNFFYRHSLWFLGLFIMIHLGCKEAVIIPRATEILIGDSTGMWIDPYDTILEGPYNSPAATLSLDLDHNGSDDVQFTIQTTGSPAVGKTTKARMICLHGDIEVVGYYTNDTLFLNRVTGVYDAGTNYYIRQLYNYTCFRRDASDSVLNVTLHSFKISPLDQNDTLKLTDTASSATIRIIDESFSPPETTVAVIGDTIILRKETFFNDCFPFPKGKETYMGFKFLNDDRLGWIRIEAEGNELHLAETAIQK